MYESIERLYAQRDELVVRASTEAQVDEANRHSDVTHLHATQNASQSAFQIAGSDTVMQALSSVGGETKEEYLESEDPLQPNPTNSVDTFNSLQTSRTSASVGDAPGASTGHDTFSNHKQPSKSDIDQPPSLAIPCIVPASQDVKIASFDNHSAPPAKQPRLSASAGNDFGDSTSSSKSSTEIEIKSEPLNEAGAARWDSNLSPFSGDDNNATYTTPKRTDGKRSLKKKVGNKSRN